MVSEIGKKKMSELTRGDVQKLYNTKTEYSVSVPDYVFEAILQEREKYERNKRRRGDAFQDMGRT